MRSHDRPISAPCPTCGRATRIRNDGDLTRHRVRPDDPSAPWCPASSGASPRDTPTDTAGP